MLEFPMNELSTGICQTFILCHITFWLLGISRCLIQCHSFQGTQWNRGNKNIKYLCANGLGTMEMVSLDALLWTVTGRNEEVNFSRDSYVTDAHDNFCCYKLYWWIFFDKRINIVCETLSYVWICLCVCVHIFILHLCVFVCLYCVTIKYIYFWT